MSISKNKGLGAVIIGRNEGQRLINCIESLKLAVDKIVYVDSGSDDNSLEEAESRAVHCVSLDLSRPFTAARARNEGAEYLLKLYPEIQFIQFVDGDCEIQNSWVEHAKSFLSEHSKYAVVCGRRRERFPEKSIYNQLCDIEWDTPIGDANSCGGDALVRVSAFNEVRGYNAALIAGEEPEMCFRLRKKGWGIYRLDSEMTLHDAAMTHLSQWWNRARRAGFAYANGCYLHGKSEEKYNLKPTLSILIWGLLIPSFIIMLSLYNSLFIILLSVFPLQVVRLALKNSLNGRVVKHRLIYAMSNVFGKFPQCVGVIGFLKNKVQNRQNVLIEYK